MDKSVWTILDWKLKYYNNREIKTSEDVVWVAKEVERAFQSGNVSVKDMAAYSYLESIMEAYDDSMAEPIENRWEILDL